MKKINNNKKLLVRVAVYAAAAVLIALYLIFMRGNGCVIYNFFKKPCISCGATRSFFALLRGDIASAEYLNPIFAFGIFPVLIILAVQDFAVAVWRAVKKINMQSLAEYLFVRG